MGNCRGDFPTYIGTSIKSSKKELEKLKKLGLPIFFYDCPEAYHDKVGGYHDYAEGWNLNGMWCGECTNKSCAKYLSKDIKKEDRNGKLPQR